MILLHLTIANIKMIARDRQAVFWALAFPVMMVVIFGLLGFDREFTARIAVVDHSGDDLSMQLIENLRDVPSFEVDVGMDEETARRQIREDDLEYLVIMPHGFETTAYGSAPVSVTVVYDNANPSSGSVIKVISGILDQMNMSISGAKTRLTLRPEGILARDFRMIDFMLPGIVIWGIMANSVIGVATNMARYREKQVFKRINASPLHPGVFFGAQVLAFLALALLQAMVILSLGSLAFDVSIEGNLLIIGLLALIGNVIFLNLGFIVGTLSKTVAAAAALGNLVVLPLIFLSGVFFPSNVLPAALVNVVQFLPLAPVVDTIRGVTLEAKGLFDFQLQLAIIGAWIVATSLVSIRLFKFE